MAHRDLNFDFKKLSYRLRTLEDIVEHDDEFWNCDARCQLGEIYLNGWEGVQRDPERAYHLFCQAAMGDDMAVSNVGLCLWKGWGTEQNIFQAIYYFAWAIYGTWNEADHYGPAEDLEARKDAIRNLKACFESMSYEEQEKMVKKLKIAMETNRLLLPVVGYCYMNGYGVERNLAEAKHIFDYNEDAHFGEPPYKHVARALRDDHILSAVTDEMMQTYEPVNNLECMYDDVLFKESIQYQRLLEDYLREDDAPVYSENEYDEQQLASLGHTAEVNYKIGKCLLKGAPGIKQNKELAFRHFLAAARNHSYPEGSKDKYYYRTGVCYMKGIGTQQDWLKAAFCFMGALYSKEYLQKKTFAEKPDFNVNREAKKNLKLCFDSISREEQERLLSRMLEKMKRERIFTPIVAYCYMNGYGVQQDLAEAKYLFDYIMERNKRRYEPWLVSSRNIEANILLGRALRDEDVLNAVDEETMDSYEPTVKLNEIYNPCFLKHGCYDTYSDDVELLEMEAQLSASLFYYENFINRLESCKETSVYCEMGMCLLNGTYGLKKDEKMAFREFMAAAFGRCSNKEYYMVGLCYMQGIGIRRNMMKAIFWLVKSMHSSIQVKDEACFFRKIDWNAYNEAKSMLKKCFESIGYEEQRMLVEKFIAMIKLDSRFIAIVAYCFQYGYGVGQDIVEAKRLFGHQEESTEREKEYQRMVRTLCDDSQLSTVDEEALKAHKPIVDTSMAHMPFHTYGDSSEHVEDFCYYIDEEELMDFEDGRIEDFAFYGCNFWKENIVLPDTVRHIGDGAFCGCPNLKTLLIPPSVEYIGQNFLEECRGLKSVTVLWDTPLEMDYASAYLKKIIQDWQSSAYTYWAQRRPKEPVLYVPKGTWEKYRKARFWGDFPVIMEYSVYG